MRLRKSALGLATCVVLAACGGGGGGEVGTSAQATVPTVQTGPAAVVINESSAPVVTAHAAEAAQGNASTQNALGLLGVQVQAGDAVQPPLLWVIGAARTLATSASLATGVAVDETRPCPLGGTIRMLATIANDETLSAGDVITLSALDCRLTVAGVTNTMGGSMTMKVNSATEAAGALRANLTLTTSALSVQSGAGRVVITGEQVVDFNEAAAATTVESTGANLTTQATSATGSRTTVWKNFRHRFVLGSNTVTASVSGDVESDSTKLGATGGSYTVSTPTPLGWNSVTGAMMGGVMTVVGASNSQMRITFSATGAVIAVDANGDGSFEKTVNATPAELKALL